MQLITTEADQWLLENGGWNEKGCHEKGYEKIWGGDAYVHYIDDGDGFIGVYMLKLITLYTLC